VPKNAQISLIKLLNISKKEGKLKENGQNLLKRIRGI